MADELIRREDALAAVLRVADAQRIAALPVVVPSVKPLVWFEVERGQNGYGKWTAEGYTVRKIEGLFLLDFAGDSKSVWRFPTAAAAKAAAQQDYTARILAPLAVAAPDPAAIREAALRECSAVVDAELMRWGFPSTDGCRRDELHTAILALIAKGAAE